MTANSVPYGAGRNALVTGASVGIGRALAIEMASHGHDLLLVARDVQRLDQLSGELQDKYGVSARVFVRDLSQPTAVPEIVWQLQQESIQIDLLVNNAGFDLFGNFWEIDLELELQLIQVNLVSLTLLTRLLLPGMVQRGYGRILNLGSTGSFLASPLNAVYSATKAYVLSFSEAVGEELRGSGVTVTALCPGATRTEFHRRANATNIPLLRFGVLEAEQVAEIGYRAMIAGKRVVVPGLSNRLQVFFSRVMPKGFMLRMAKRMLSRPGASQGE